MLGITQQTTKSGDASVQEVHPPSDDLSVEKVSSIEVPTGNPSSNDVKWTAATGIDRDDAADDDDGSATIVDPSTAIPPPTVASTNTQDMGDMVLPEPTPMMTGTEGKAARPHDQPVEMHAEPQGWLGSAYSTMMMMPYAGATTNHPPSNGMPPMVPTMMPYYWPHPPPHPSHHPGPMMMAPAAAAAGVAPMPQPAPMNPGVYATAASTSTTAPFVPIPGVYYDPSMEAIHMPLPGAAAGYYVPTSNAVDPTDPRLVVVCGLDLNVVDEWTLLRAFQWAGHVRCVGFVRDGVDHCMGASSSSHHHHHNNNNNSDCNAQTGTAWIMFYDLHDTIKAAHMNMTMIAQSKVSVYLPNVPENLKRFLDWDRLRQQEEVKESQRECRRQQELQVPTAIVKQQQPQLPPSQLNREVTPPESPSNGRSTAATSPAPPMDAIRKDPFEEAFEHCNRNEVRKNPDGSYEIHFVEVYNKLGDALRYLMANDQEMVSRSTWELRIVSRGADPTNATHSPPPPPTFGHCLKTKEEAIMKCMIQFLLVEAGRSLSATSSVTAPAGKGVAPASSVPSTPPVPRKKQLGREASISLSSSQQQQPSQQSSQLQSLPVEMDMPADETPFKMFKTRLCNSWLRHEQARKDGGEQGEFRCPRGDECPYAHGHDQLRRNPLFKTRICEMFWQTGECKYSQRNRGGCHFAHSLDELRPEGEDL